MGETMNFPDTWKEFANEFGFSDSEEVYTNGTKLIPVFRVEQWLEHISRGERIHSEYDFLQDKVNELTEENKELREKLEFIEQGQPHPCTFDGKRHVSEYTLIDWFSKLKEEVAEVEVEIEEWGDLTVKDILHMRDWSEDDKLEHLTEELFDVITVATSTLEWLGWSVYGRLQKQKEVNEKNKRRGYWK